MSTAPVNAPREAVVVPFKVLAEIQRDQAVMLEKLTQLKADQEEFKELRGRIEALERTLAADNRGRQVWRWVLDAFLGLGLAVVAAGVYIRK